MGFRERQILYSSIKANYNLININYHYQNMPKTPEINFKRKKSGAGSWGIGLDYLLKDYWNDLDKIVEDNYYGRHNKKLINSLFPKVFLALKRAVLLMKKYGDWIKKAQVIQKFGSLAKTLSEKVVFIDAVTQFLRETSMGRVKISKTNRAKKARRKSEIKEIKGVVASIGDKSGRIKSTVKIILSEKDFPKVKKGDILVTDETDASFLPAMIKAKAVVTDLGGILCHAAIVSRELKIPCVVGTKNATQILKNGNKIEINTKNGAVKILKIGKPKVHKSPF